VNICIGFHIQHVISSWGGRSAPELLVWGKLLTLLAGNGSPRLLACSPDWQRIGRGRLFWQEAMRTLAGPTGLRKSQELSPAFVLASLSALHRQYLCPHSIRY
jgi:hypothetical protein